MAKTKRIRLVRSVTLNPEGVELSCAPKLIPP
jgi:hypothetical protein